MFIFPTPGDTPTAYLEHATAFVLAHRYTTIPLSFINTANNTAAVLILGPVEDTEYKDKPGELHGCSKFYLPTQNDLVIIGYATDTPYYCNQLIIMVDQLGRLYGYDGDEVHLLADDFKQQQRHGDDVIELYYPSLNSYYYGQAFENVTAEFWDRVNNSPRVKEMEENYYKFLESRTDMVLKMVQKSKEKRRRLRTSRLVNGIEDDATKGLTRKDV